MPLYRFFSPLSLPEGETLHLEGAEARHFLLVLRAQKGQVCEVFNGRGTLAKAELIGRGKDQAILRLISCLNIEKPSLQISLLQAHLRPSAFSYCVEKATELGISNLYLFPARASQRQTVSDAEKRRLEKIVLAAAKQSGLLFFPKIVFLDTLSSFSFEGQVFWGALQESPPLFSFLPIQRNSCIAIGPESGFSSEEVDFFEAQNAQAVSLHPQTLRAETAACTALSLLSQHGKNFKSFCS